MKTLRSHKFSDTCLAQMAWLRKRLNLGSDTAVLENSVAELFHRKKSEYREFLVPRGDHFNLMVGDVPIAEVSPELAGALPKDFLDRKGSDIGSMLSMLYITLARGNKGTMTIDHDALASLFSSKVPAEG